jgi:hypothetical protein
MAGTIEQYYGRLRQEKETLRARHALGYLHITSVANSGTGSTAGTVAEVSIHNAAIAILAGNAVESTPEDVEKHQARGRSFQALTNERTQRERKSTILITEVK